MSLKATQIQLEIGKKTLLHNISLEVKSGEFVAILGPNGAGKSSLFKVLTQEYAFYDGDVSLNGRHFETWKPEQVALMMGVLPQSSALNFPFSAYEVVLLGRLPHSSGRTRDQEIALEALKKVDACHLAESSYLSLSGGEKQRVQLARVLAQIWEPTELSNSRFLLLDEPTSALDLAHQHLILKQAKQLTKEGLGVIAILHDLNLASEYADRLIMLRQGEIFAQGTVTETLNPETIQHLFDIDVDVIPHPQTQHPLVISRPTSILL